MATLSSKINTRSAEFAANAASLKAAVDDLKAKVAHVAQGGSAEARAKHTGRGKLLPRQRVEQLSIRERRSSNSRNWRRTTCTATPRPARV